MSVKSNIWKMYAFKFFASMNFFGAVLVPFFTDWGGITLTQIMILQSWFMLWGFVMEMPTGAFADYFGRKYSLSIGCVVNVVAAIVYASVPNFYVFLFAEFLWAISSAFASGADDAFVYDSLKRTGDSKKSKKIFGRLRSFNLVGYLSAGIVGGVMASRFGLRAPMLLTALPLFVAFLISLSFKEPKMYQKVGSKSYIRILKDGIRFFRGHGTLKILALDMIAVSTIVYFILWLYQPMLKQAGVGVEYFGVVYSAMVVSEMAVINKHQVVETLFGSKKRVLFFSSAITGSMFVIGGVTNFLPLVLVSIIVGGGIGLSREPLLASYMNKHIPSEKRATVLSTINMVSRLPIAILSPLVGVMIDWSVSYTLVILGLLAIAFSFASRVEEKHLIE